MNSRELYINDSLMDLDEKETIEFTFQVNDIADLVDRQASYSSEFHLPFTKNNLQALEWSNELQSTSVKPYTKLPVRYVEDGVEIIKSGSAIITKSDTGFNLTIYGGLLDFFTLLQNGISADGSYGLKLTDIDTSDIDHFWNESSIQDSWNNDLGYIYAVIDTGYHETASRVVDSYHQHPSVYIKYLINKIFNAQGYQVSGTVFETIGNRLDRMLMPVTNNIFNYKYLLSKAIVTDALKNQFALSLVFNSVNDSMPASVYANSILNESFFAGGLSGTADPSTHPPTRYRCYGRGQYSFRASLSFKIDTAFSFPAANYTVAVFKRHGNDSTMVDTLFTQTYTAGGSGVYGTAQALEIDLQNVACERGDRIWVTIDPGANQTWSLFTGSYFECYAAQALIGFGIQQLVGTTDWYQVGINLPSWLQSDFLKAIFQLLAISPDIKGEQALCVLHQFQDLTGSMPVAKDITGKIERATKPAIEYHNTTYGQQNWFRYSPDTTNNEINASQSDTVNDAYGNPIIDDGTPRGFADSSFSINDASLDIVKEAIQLPFGATFTVPMFENVISCQIELYNFNPYIDSSGSSNDFGYWKHINNYSSGEYVLYKGRLFKCTSSISDLAPDEEANNTGYEGGGQNWTLIEDRTNTITPRIIILEDRNTIPGDQFQYTKDGDPLVNMGNNPPLTYFSKTGGAYNLDWYSLFNDEYVALISMLQSYKKVTVLCNFTQQDIDELDHFIPVYDAVTSSYYYLNKIDPYAAGYKATVELVRMGF